MKLSVETFIARNKFDDETAIKMIKNAGFDAYDYSMYRMSGEKDALGEDWRERAQRLRLLADETGIECNQAHAPFDFEFTDEMSVENENYCRLVRSVEVAAILGAKNIIIHSIYKNLPPDVDFAEYNRSFYKSFIPYCEKFGICISVENLFNITGDSDKKFLPVLCDPEKHIEFVKSLNSKCFNICIDVGHSALTGYKPEEVLASMPDYMLKALHIHDNNFDNDDHLLPYEGSFDWEKITSALSNIGYNGDFTFEVIGFLQRLDNDGFAEGLKIAAKTGRNLIDKIIKSEN